MYNDIVSNKTFDPDKIIDYSQDYFAILDIDRDQLPNADTPNGRRDACDVLDKAYRRQAFKKHPDLGGTDHDFKLLVRAHSILSDPLLRKIYESGGAYRPNVLNDENQEWEIDWDKLGNYRKGTTADTLGYGLFAQLNNKADDLNIVPAFFPSEPYHSYSWDFVILDKELASKEIPKLTLSIVPDEEEVLRLTDSTNINKSLPFKMYLYVPRSFVHSYREEGKIIHAHGQDIEYAGSMKGAIYSDIDLVEATDYDVLEQYIESQLEIDLQRYRSGELEQIQQTKDIQAKQSQWLSTSQIQQVDADLLKSIMRSRAYGFSLDPAAPNFIDEMRER